MLVTETGENWPGSRRVREEKSELFRWATTWSEWRCLLAASVQSWDSLCLCLPSSLCSIMYTGICQVLLLFVRSGTSLTQFDVSPVLTAKCFCWAYGHWIGQLVSLSLDYLLGWMDDAVWMCECVMCLLNHCLQIQNILVTDIGMVQSGIRWTLMLIFRSLL